jgi:hypothetical protein
MLLNGDLHVMDSDQQTFLFKIPEGTVFGEGSVLRRLEVGREEGRGRTDRGGGGWRLVGQQQG